MECNKDEALRSRDLAEQKFLQHDLVGAKKFALKAQYLFPNLEGLPQLMAVIDVHIVEQQKVNGVEVNWYGILQTDATADEATIRKQYRKLALILHPDKNKAVGAEGAFKLISEAWGVLSDKEKKAAHDARRVNSYKTPQSMSTKTSNGFCNFNHFSTWCQRRPAHKSNSFWTECSFCKMQLEYLRVHENKKLSCPSCGKLFLGAEMPETSGTSFSHLSEQSTRRAGSSCPQENPNSVRKDGFSRPENPGAAHSGSNFSFQWGNHRHAAAKYVAEKATAEMVHQTYETVRRERVKAQKEAREKVAKERMEAEKEARRREHRDRKQKRKKEHQAKVALHAKKAFDNLFSREPVYSSSFECERSDAVSSMSSKDVENGNADSNCPPGTIDHQQGQEPCIGEGGNISPSAKASKAFAVQEQTSIDSTNAYDSQDVFSFSKRLKVDA